MRKLDEALNYLRSEDWENLHTLVQNDQSKEAAWIHAHLHRVEGDMANARYWYERAGRVPATGDPADERRELIAVLDLQAQRNMSKTSESR